jgi:phytoene/squalene synthetase
MHGNVVFSPWHTKRAIQILPATNSIGIRYLHPDGRFAICAAAEFYRAILADIKRHDYDVFTRRAQMTKWSKIRQLPRIWWQSRRNLSSYSD